MRTMLALVLIGGLALIGWFDQRVFAEDKDDFLSYLIGTWEVSWQDDQNSYHEIDTFQWAVVGKSIKLSNVILRDGVTFLTGSGLVAQDPSGRYHHFYTGSTGNVIVRSGALQEDGSYVFEGISHTNYGDNKFKIIITDREKDSYSWTYFIPDEDGWKEYLNLTFKRTLRE